MTNNPEETNHERKVASSRAKPLAEYRKRRNNSLRNLINSPLKAKKNKTTHHIDKSPSMSASPSSASIPLTSPHAQPLSQSPLHVTNPPQSASQPTLPHFTPPPSLPSFSDVWLDYVKQVEGTLHPCRKSCFKDFAKQTKRQYSCSTMKMDCEECTKTRPIHVCVEGCPHTKPHTLCDLAIYYEGRGYTPKAYHNIQPIVGQQEYLRFIQRHVVVYLKSIYDEVVERSNSEDIPSFYEFFRVVTRTYIEDKDISIHLHPNDDDNGNDGDGDDGTDDGDSDDGDSDDGDSDDGDSDDGDSDDDDDDTDDYYDYYDDGDAETESSSLSYDETL